MGIPYIAAVAIIAIAAGLGSWIGAWTWRANNYERTKLVVSQILLEAELRTHTNLKEDDE